MTSPPYPVTLRVHRAGSQLKMSNAKNYKKLKLKDLKFKYLYYEINYSIIIVIIITLTITTPIIIIIQAILTFKLISLKKIIIENSDTHAHSHCTAIH